MRFGPHAAVFLTVYRLAAARGALTSRTLERFHCPPGDMNDKESIRKLMDEALASVKRGDIEGSLVPQASDAHMLVPLHPAEVGSAAIRTSLESLFND